MSDQKLIVDPTTFVARDSRLLIDTNVFMNTDPKRAGALKALFERCAPVIVATSNPIVVPSKVVDELTKQSRLDPSGLTAERAAAVKKAANALVFLESASKKGLVQKDLGDDTNPYADDLFVKLFEAFADKYQMCLLTFDITLKMRIRLLAARTSKRLFVGTVNKDGNVEFDTDQVLFERACRKLARIQTRIQGSAAEPKDQQEVALLEPLLREFRSVFGVKEIHVATKGQPAKKQPAATKDSDQKQKAGSAFPITHKLRPDDSVIPVSSVPGSGDPVLLLTSDSSQVSQFKLGEELGEGGEGSVFAVDGANVAKIFDQDHITIHRKEKIKLLVESNLSFPGVCVPTGIILNGDGDFVGYMMPKAAGKEFQRTIFRPRRFKEAFPNWSKADLVDVCIAFLEKVSYLHSQNIYLGDINPKNLMIDGKKQVYIIDADSWQFDGYPCPVGTPMFTSPEMQGKAYSEELRTKQDELFAVATMLFMILITGQFPYARSGSDGDIAKLITEGNFAFQFEDKNNKDQPDGDWKYMWSHIHKPVKDLFFHTFDKKDGKRYTRRPTAAEWLKAFTDYKNYLTSSENFDPMSNDVYPIRNKAFKRDTPIKNCPNCKRKAAIAGIWNDSRADYYVPPVCNKCKDAQEKCSDCGRPSNQLKDGRCSNCRLVACRECGTWTPKSQLQYGKCRSCVSREDQLDPTRFCTRCGRPFITYGHIDWHKRNGKMVPVSHRTDDPSCNPAGKRSVKSTTTTRKTQPVSTPKKAPEPATSTKPVKKESLWKRLFG